MPRSGWANPGPRQDGSLNSAYTRPAVNGANRVLLGARLKRDER
jgi:hypothetical protein